MVNATEKQIADAFTEWERKYREDPAGYMSDFDRYTKLTPKTYGELSAAYFIKLLSGEA